MKTVYLYNRAGSRNIGDELINFTIQQLLKGHQVEVRKNKLYPDLVHRGHAWKAHLKTYTEDVREIFNSEAVIIGGGNLVMDTPGLGYRWAIHHFWISLISILLRKKYYYFCVGVNPLHTKIAAQLYRFALRHAERVSVRDSLSQMYLQQLTGRNDIQLMADPVLLISNFHPARCPADLDTVGLCPVQLFPLITTDREIYQRYLDFQVRLISRFTSLGKKVFLFLNDPLADQKVREDILSLAGGKQSGLVVVKDFLDQVEYLEFLSGLGFVVTARMHAAICATSYGIASVGLGWQPKMEYFYADLGLDGYLPLLERLQEPFGVERLTKEVESLFQAAPKGAHYVHEYRFDYTGFLGLDQMGPT